MPRLVIAVCWLFLIARTAAAQDTTAATAQPPIEDNSFLLEEAFNQPAGVVQHISTFARDWDGTGWLYTFTQEWPVRGQRHQLSYTVPLQHADVSGAHTGVGDLLVNYRYQLAGNDPDATTLVAPRLSVALPTGTARHGLGAGAPGVQVNLPATVLVGRLALHGNAGGTLTPRAHDPAGHRATTRAVAVGQSAIWMVRHDLNLMVEALYTRSQEVVGDRRARWGEDVVVSPGVRAALNLQSGMQIVPGLAFPIGVGPSRGQTGVFLYLSIEHPFSAAGR